MCNAYVTKDVWGLKTMQGDEDRVNNKCEEWPNVEIWRKGILKTE